MKKLILAGAAAATVVLGGAAVANAQWSLSNRPATDGWSGSYAFAHGPDCGFVTVREHHDGRVVVRHIPRC